MELIVGQEVSRLHLWKRWISLRSLVAIHPIVPEIFQSRQKWWIEMDWWKMYCGMGMDTYKNVHVFQHIFFLSCIRQGYKKDGLNDNSSPHQLLSFYASFLWLLPLFVKSSLHHSLHNPPSCHRGDSSISLVVHGHSHQSMFVAFNQIGCVHVFACMCVCVRVRWWRGNT